jgi:hypothetical protein
LADPDTDEKRREPLIALLLLRGGAQFPGGGPFWLLFGAVAKK